MQYLECCGKHELVYAFERALVGDRNHLLRTRRQVNVRNEFAESVAHGLATPPRRLDCRFLYDKRGSELYELICKQPEYYPTRTEAAILQRHAHEISEITGPLTLLELGSGCSVKTAILLSAYQKNNGSTCYVPIDVSESALRIAGKQIVDQRPDVRIIGINGTYHDAFPLINHASPAMVLFLGSTIGNLDKEQTDNFLNWIASHLAIGDFFLLGVDLVKDKHILEEAYNDAAGVTAAFTKNLFARMNRELGSAIELDSIDHVALYNQAEEQIEINARFNTGQTISVDLLKRDFYITAGEEILVEISRKFDLKKFVPALKSYGFTVCRNFTDPANWFSLLLLKKTE